eukprot:GHVN01027121.1.p1 GENE.GHVN01027121.1~~GHVN01027121.1.p1  ORF type:complete len:404 (+),score=9.20 GHVN01027121.1:252-1463(+)
MSHSHSVAAILWRIRQHKPRTHGYMISNVDALTMFSLAVLSRHLHVWELKQNIMFLIVFSSLLFSYIFPFIGGVLACPTLVMLSVSDLPLYLDNPSDPVLNFAYLGYFTGFSSWFLIPLYLSMRAVVFTLRLQNGPGDYIVMQTLLTTSVDIAGFVFIRMFVHESLTKLNDWSRNLDAMPYVQELEKRLSFQRVDSSLDTCPPKVTLWSRRRSTKDSEAAILDSVATCPSLNGSCEMKDLAKNRANEADNEQPMSVEPSRVSYCNKSCTWRFFKKVTLMDVDSKIWEITAVKPGKLPPQRTNMTFVDGKLEALYLQLWNPIACQMYNMRWRLLVSPIVSTATHLASIGFAAMSNQYEPGYMILALCLIVLNLSLSLTLCLQSRQTGESTWQLNIITFGFFIAQ